MSSYFSLSLYILTFVIGLWLDTKALMKNYRLRSIYIVWLYIFLCFGYMTGADWRSYEEEFYNWNRVFTKDYGYVYTMNFLHNYIDDFWVLYDGFRCLYLWSVIKLLKKVTPYWLSALSFLMPMSLLSLTIDSPFRFMIALTLLNFAFIYLFKAKYIPAILLCIIAAFFHASIIVLIPLVFLLKTNIFVKANNWILILIYIAVIVFSTSLESINELQTLVGLAFSDFGLNSYKSYEAEVSANVFTFGLVLHNVIFIFILLTKDIVTRNTLSGSTVANMTILYFFVQRLGSTIPTGHRFCWLFTVFEAAYFMNLFHIDDLKWNLNNIILYNSKFVRRIKFIFVIFAFYYGSSMIKTIVNHFAYIPYTNSIPYILTEHKPYTERDKYNLDAYKQRTGKNYVLNTDK